MGFFIKKTENYFKERKVLAPSKEESCNLIKDGLQASYNIALSIANKTKPHAIGEELIMSAVTEVLKKVMHHIKHKEIRSAVLLSNNTVQRRIDEMANCVEEQLIWDLGGLNLVSSLVSQQCQTTTHPFLYM